MAESTVEWKSQLSPVSLAKFVNKKVSVLLSDGSSRDGWVYTVDPVTRSIVLLQVNERTFNSGLAFIIGHAIKAVDVQSVDESKEACPDFDKIINTRKNCNYSDEDLQQRKSDLKSWLEKNRIPVTEKNGAVLSVMDVLSIEPPYEMDCCRCSNEIILDRIQRLVRSMPSSK